MSQALGFGIVGCGGAALDVVGALDRLPATRFAAAYDVVPSLAADIVRRTKATRHDSLEALLADPIVDVVYVAVPHDLIAMVTARAIAADRPVLAEKPLAANAASIRALGRQAQAAGVALGVLFELRESGPARAARRLIADGAIGQVTAIRMDTLIDKPQTYWESGPKARSSSRWRAVRARSGGGVVLMNSIHQLDLVYALTGLEVTRAHGETGTLVADPRHVEVEDTAAATLRYHNGAIGSLAASAHSPGVRGGETIDIEGTAGTVRIPDLYSSGETQVYLREPTAGLAAGRWLSITEEHGDPFGHAVSGFVTAVRAGLPAPVGAPDAERAVTIIERIYREPTG